MATQHGESSVPGVVIFETQQAADSAVRAMQLSGAMDLRGVSMLARAHPGNDRLVGLCHTANGLVFRGRDGAFWTDLAGRAGSAALLHVPPCGAVAAIGPVAQVLGESKPAAYRNKDVSAMSAAFAALGLSRVDAQRCESALWADQFVLIVHGGPPAAEVAHPDSDESRSMPVLKVV